MDTAPIEPHHAVCCAYLDALRSCGRNRHQVTSAKVHLRRFFRFCDESSLDFEALRYRDAMAFRQYLIDAGFSRNGVNRYVSAIRSFYQFLVSSKRTMDNPFSSVRNIREETRVLRCVGKEADIDHFLSSLEDFFSQPTLWEKIRWYRAHVVAELLYSTGMRLGEAATLTVDDVNLLDRTVLIKDTKSKQVRTCFLHTYVTQVVELYLCSLRAWIVSEADNRLFGLSKDRLNYLVNIVYKAKCSDPLKLTSHGFRHAFGSHLLRSGCDLRIIQSLLGHQHIGSTQIYTTIEKEELKEVIDQFHPRQWRKR